MKVLYQNKYVLCYAILYNRKDKSSSFLLSKKDTTSSGASKISYILTHLRNEELHYIHPSIEIDTEIEDDFYWFNEGTIKIIPDVLTNKDALPFLLKQ